jgi:hypothetical protein
MPQLSGNEPILGLNNSKKFTTQNYYKFPTMNTMQESKFCFQR